ncbi:MAG: sulfatase-like hydrolase/transferase [Candidatus Aminicenantes bacterium]|nr:MAG: sulfatase-like hydrolase/transferase [Candidatus Aminicenantes bacterium]
MTKRKILLLICICVISFVLPGCRRSKKPHILLITIDTLRRDRLGCYGYSLNTSPFIDQLASEGVLFKHAVTPLPLTSPSHASILTSLHPLTHQVMHNSAVLNPEIETLAEALKDKSYYTIGAVAVKHLSGKYNFSQGFDSFSDHWDPGIKDWKGVAKHFVGKWQRVAKSVNISLIEQVENYLDKHFNKPLFIWVHYFDPHYPYIDREDIVLSRKKKQWIQYDKEVRYTDNYIKKLYRFLEKKGLTDKLITCITADHGEQLGEHGFGAQHVDFYSETTFVPLIFHGFKIPQNKIVEELVSTMDIGVTLLKLANLNYKKPVDGIPILKLGGKLAAIRNREQLIVEDLRRVRSLQLISFPYSYILNFDFFYKSWFFTGKSILREGRFKRIPNNWVTVKYFDEKDCYELRMTFPYAYTYGKGMNFAVLRFEIEKNNGVYVGFKLNVSKWLEPFYINDETKSVTVFFPVTAADQLTAFIGFKKGAKFANLEYAFLPRKEFLGYTQSTKEIESKEIYGELQTLRKFKSSDELYDLDSDIEMIKDLFKSKKQIAEAVAAEGNRQIYELLDHYLRKIKEIMGRSKPERALTEKEKEMLKSLGYF